MSGLPLQDLLPCPCCAGQAVLQWSKHSGLFYVDCEVCRLGTAPTVGIDEAVGVWNRRTNRTAETLRPTCRHVWQYEPSEGAFRCLECNIMRAGESS